MLVLFPLLVHGTPLLIEIESIKEFDGPIEGGANESYISDIAYACYLILLLFNHFIFVSLLPLVLFAWSCYSSSSFL